MEFFISNTDIAEAIKNREKFVDTVKDMTYNNAIIFNGSIIDSLISLKLRIPRINYNGSFKSFSRLLSIEKWDKCSIGFSSNDLRLFPVIEEFFNGLGMPVQWSDGITVPSNNGIYLHLTFPNKIHNPKVFYSSVLEFLDNYFHLRVERKTTKSMCDSRCINENGSSGKIWYFPKLCKFHIAKLTSESIKKLINDEDDTNMQFSTESRNAYQFLMKSVMNNYRSFKSHLRTVDRCVICKDKAPTLSFTFLTNVLCDSCFNTIMWNNFEIDYKNKLVEWEELFENKEILNKYTKGKEQY